MQKYKILMFFYWYSYNFSYFTPFSLFIYFSISFSLLIKSIIQFKKSSLIFEIYNMCETFKIFYFYGILVDVGDSKHDIYDF